MSYLFISHSSKNNFHAIAIQDWLVAQGWDELFLDLDPERGIVAGQRWEKALHDAASRCDAVLFLVSQDWLDSEWCRKEFRLAHRLNKRIIGLLIEDIDIDTLPDEVTSTWQLINLSTGNDHQLIPAIHPDTGEEQHVHFSRTGLTRLKTGLIKAGLDPMFYQWPPEHDPDRSPYRGMLPLEAEDAGIFFGREAPTNELLAKLRGLRADPPPRFMVVLGASGSGKSSFLRAGVLPRLSRDERNFLTLPIIRPEQAVLWGDNGLLSSLSQICENQKLRVNRGTIRKSIENNSSELIELLQKISETAKLPALAGETSSHPPTLILTIDQGEELFHSEGSEQSKQFLKLLKQLASHQKLPLILLFTIRSDSYERLQTHQSLEGISQQTFSLAPMPKGAYQAIIEGPANRLKDTDRPLEIEPALTQVLLEDIEKGGNKDALPILAFTLERLYIDYGSDGDLRLDEYEDMGGLQGAINAAVEIALANAKLDPALPNDEQQIKNLLRRGLIPWLAGIDPDTQSPRRRVAKLSEIPSEARPIINHLIEQRLLSTDTETITKNGKTTVGETTIEPAHETLLRQWGLLKDWLEEDLSTLTTLENVQRASRDWAANNQHQDYLAHNAGRLQDAESLKQRDDISRFLTNNDWDYLKACRALEDQQRDKELAEAKKLAQAQKQEVIAQKKVARRTTMGMITAFLLTLIAGFLGWQSYKAENQVNLQLIESNHNLGLSLFESAKLLKTKLNYKKSSELLQESLKYLKKGENKALVIGSLLQDYNKNKTFGTVDNGIFISDIFTISANERYLVFLDDEKNVIILDLVKGDNRIIKEFDIDVSYIEFSPFDKRIAIGLINGVLQTWDIEQEIFITFSGHTKRINQIKFSSNGKKLLSCSNDGTIKLWDIVTGNILEEYEGDSSVYKSCDLNYKNNKIVASSENLIEIWNVNYFLPFHKIHINKFRIYEVNKVAFLPKKNKFVSVGSGYKSIHVWNIQQSGAFTTINDNAFKKHEISVNDISFSKDVSKFTSCSYDEIVLWEKGNSNLAAKIINTDSLWGKDNYDVFTFISGDFMCEKVIVSDSSSFLVFGGIHGIQFIELGNSTYKNILDENIEDFSYSLSGDSIIYSTIEKKDYSIIDLLTNKLVMYNSIDIENVSQSYVSSNLRYIAIISNKESLLIHDTSLKKNIVLVKNNKKEMLYSFFSSTGTFLTTVSKDEVDVWNLDDFTNFRIIQEQKTTSVTFSNDEKYLAISSNDKNINIWNVENKNKEIALISQINIDNMLFSKDNKILICTSYDGIVEIWDIKSKKIINTINTRYKISSIASSPLYDNLLVIGSHDGKIILLDIVINDIKTILTIQGEETIFKILFSPNGNIISALNVNGNLFLEDISEFNKFYKDNNYIIKLSDKINNPIIENQYLMISWPKNHPFHWLDKAENGDVESMLQLGIIYHRNSEKEKAKYWYSKAHEFGNTSAEHRLKILKYTSSIQEEKNHLLVKRAETLVGLKNEYNIALSYILEYLNLEKIEISSSKGINHILSYERYDLYILWSWCMIFTGNHAEIILTLNKLFEFLENKNGAIIYLKKNLAHAYILSGDYDSAKAIYIQFKDQKFPDGRSWDTVVIEDFKALKDEGIEHPDFTKIAKEVFGVDGF